MNPTFSLYFDAAKQSVITIDKEFKKLEDH